MTVRTLEPNTIATIAQRYGLTTRRTRDRLNLVGCPKMTGNRFTGVPHVPPKYIARADLLFVLQSANLLQRLDCYPEIVAPRQTNVGGLNIPTEPDHFAAVARWLKSTWQIDPAFMLDRYVSAHDRDHVAVANVRDEFIKRGLIAAAA